MYLIVDNTKELGAALMTPKLIDYFKSRSLKFTVVSSCHQISEVIKAGSRVSGIILSGGPLRLIEKVDLELFRHNLMVLLRFPDIPVLGICFGCQVMALAYGGQLDSLPQEYTGLCTIDINSSSFHQTLEVFASHHDYVSQVPTDFVVTATSSSNCGCSATKMIQAFEAPALKRWGVQFHPEGSEDGNLLLDNFIAICSTNE